MATEINKRLYWQYWREPTTIILSIYAKHKTHSVCRLVFPPLYYRTWRSLLYSKWYHRLLAAGWLASHRRVSGEDDGWGQLNEETMKLGPRGISWSGMIAPFPLLEGAEVKERTSSLRRYHHGHCRSLPCWRDIKRGVEKKETTEGTPWIENKERKGRVTLMIMNAKNPTGCHKENQIHEHTVVILLFRWWFVVVFFLRSTSLYCFFIFIVVTFCQLSFVLFVFLSICSFFYASFLHNFYI